MKYKTLVLLSILTLLTACKVGINFDSGFGYTVVRGGGTFGSILQLSGANIPINGEIFRTNQDVKVASDIRLYNLQLKGFKPAQVPTDKNAAQALVDNKATFTNCTGAPDMSWITTADIYIVNNLTGDRELLARWSNNVNDNDNLKCVLTFETQAHVNIKDFMPEFSIELDATGKQPQSDTFLGGTVGIDASI